MQIALIGIGKIANYQMQAITLCTSPSEMDALLTAARFSYLTAMLTKGEDNTELSEVLHRLLFAALNH
ncbi:MAG: hypothetical protein L3J79_11875 [Candidatus Marinimicrobia bacterium]|nr:hypothetical protein [Candidatus Neomarinimicrobiota bacterium]